MVTALRQCSQSELRSALSIEYTLGFKDLVDIKKKKKKTLKELSKFYIDHILK